MDVRSLAPISRAEKAFARHRRRPVFAFAEALWARDREAAGTVISSAIAFRLFLFFIPLLLFVVGLAGFIASWVHVDQVNDITGLTGQMAAQMRAAFDQPTSTRWIALLTGLFGMATTGRSLAKVMTAASTLAWRLPVVTKAPIRVVGAIMGLVGGLTVCATLVNRIRAEFGVTAAGVSFLGVAVVYLVVWLALFSLLPRSTPDPGSLIPGAVLMAASQTTLQVVSQLYLPGRFESASALYGAVGSAVVTLGWFFFLGRALMIAMTVNAVVHERYGSVTELVFALPVVRRLPARSATIRRIFAIGPDGQSIPPQTTTGDDDEAGSVPAEIWSGPTSP